MSNEPNNTDPKPTQPNPLAAENAQPVPEGNADDGSFDLADLEIEFAEPLSDLGEEELAFPPDDLPAPLAPPSAALPEPETVSFDDPIPLGEAASMTMGISLKDLPDLADLLDLPEATGLSGVIPPAEPISGVGEIPSAEPASGVGQDAVPSADPASAVALGQKPGLGSSVVLAEPVHENPQDVGNLEPIAPVAPASGWLDSDVSTPVTSGDGMFAEPLEVHQADLFGTPLAVESSDIFSQGPVPTAGLADQADVSDVIAATAYGPALPVDSNKPARPSEIALSFDQPPGGSTIQEVGGSGDLPVADELPDSSENLFDAPLATEPFDSSQLSQTPILPVPVNDATDYGATPFATPDASSILADLAGPGEITFDDSSSVRLEAPGIERTLSSNLDEGTEFDLTITDDPAPPELSAADAESSDSGNVTDWREQAGSDLFADASTAPEIDLEENEGRVDPIDNDLTADEASLTSAPSSIFSGGEVTEPAEGKSSGLGSASVRIGRPPDDEDAAVEFSDHPTADPEASSAALLGPMSPVRIPRLSAPPTDEVDFDSPKKPAPTSATSADDDQDSGKVDWGAAATAEDVEATMYSGFDSPPSGILKRGRKPEEPDEEMPPRAEPAAKEKSKPAKPGKGNKLARTTPPETRDVPEGSDPSVEIDWMAGSSSEEPIVADEADVVAEESPRSKVKDKGKTKEKGKEKGKAKDKSKPKEKERSSADHEPVAAKKGGGGWIGGTLLGMVVAGGACAGVYFGGVVPNAEPPSQTSKGQPTQPGTHEGPPPLTVADAQTAIGAGDPAKALKVLESVNAATPEKVTTEAKAATGEARLFARVQELNKTNVAFASADDPELKKAREDLQAVVDDAESGEKTAVKAFIQIGVTHELAGERDEAKKVYEAGIKKFPKFAETFQSAIDRLAATAPTMDGTSRRLAPLDAEQLLFAVLLLQADAPKTDELEAGVFFWKAVNFATAGKYGDAVDEIKKAKAAHVKQAKTLAGRGLNPLSDPLEQIFPRCCDDLKTYWELRAAIYANKTIADLIKTDGPEKAMAALAVAQKKAIEAIKLMTDLKDATDKLVKATTDLNEAKEDFAKKEKQFLVAETTAKEKLMELDLKFTKTETERKKAEDLVTSLTKELQAAKLLPDLRVLVPSEMMAVGGSPLSAAQLIDVAKRLTKAEETARIATDKLAAETKRFTTEHAAELKKLKEGHATDVKKLTDEYATEMKKLTETYATNTTKLKDDQAVELKKMTDKFALDVKKLTEDNAAAVKKLTEDNTVAVKKLTEGFEGKIKGLEATVVKTKEAGDVAVVKTKEAGEAIAAKLRVELGNSVSPAQALDLWLPQLTELRRLSDADPALANATKALASAGADSEDAAKARTVAGLALLLKGDLPLAKAMFQEARSSPAYKAAAGKEWAKVADLGLASIDDPLAPYRLPVEKPRRNPKVAARFLDTGITAYKAGRYSEAVTALIESTKADPTDPLAWYYLGASRWSAGSTDQAKEDYRQGGEWEKLSAISSRIISGNLAPIQGDARDALNYARP